jgi:hypothetical protein
VRNIKKSLQEKIVMHIGILYATGLVFAISSISASTTGLHQFAEAGEPLQVVSTGTHNGFHEGSQIIIDFNKPALLHSCCDGYPSPVGWLIQVTTTSSTNVPIEMRIENGDTRVRLLLHEGYCENLRLWLGGEKPNYITDRNGYPLDGDYNGIPGGDFEITLMNPPC